VGAMTVIQLVLYSRLTGDLPVCKANIMTAKELDEIICCWAIEYGYDFTEEELDSLIDRLLKAYENPIGH
jgi:hypothetical protein